MVQKKSILLITSTGLVGCFLNHQGTTTSILIIFLFFFFLSFTFIFVFLLLHVRSTLISKSNPNKVHNILYELKNVTPIDPKKSSHLNPILINFSSKCS